MFAHLVLGKGVELRVVQGLKALWCMALKAELQNWKQQGHSSRSIIYEIDEEVCFLQTDSDTTVVVSGSFGILGVGCLFG